MTAVCLLAIGAFALASCGIKPANVDPPAKVKKDSFPRTYPDPATDPAPQ